MRLQWYGRCHGASCLSRTWACAMFDFNGLPGLSKLAPSWMSSSALLTDISAPLPTNRLCYPPSGTLCTCMLPLAKPVRLYKPQDSSSSVRFTERLLFVLSVSVPPVTYHHYRPGSLWGEAIHARMTRFPPSEPLRQIHSTLPAVALPHSYQL